MEKKHKFTLTQQFLILIVVFFAVPVSFISYFLYSKTMNDLKNIEREQVVSYSHGVVSLVQQMGSNLLGVTESNSHWSEARKAVLNGDVKWIQQNINVAAGIVPNLNFVATADLRGNILTQVGDFPSFTKQLAYPGLLEMTKKEANFSGLVVTPKGIAIVAVSKITNESATLPPTGILVFGRKLDLSALDVMKGTAKSEVALYANNGELLTTTPTVSRQDFILLLSSISSHEEHDVFRTTNQGSTRTAEYITSIHDVSNHPIGLLFVRYPLRASSEVTSDMCRKD